MPVSTVAVIGCGTIGASWARAFASSGFRVQAWDPVAGFDRSFDPAVEIIACDTLGAAISGADFVQESGPEQLSLKAELFAAMAHDLAPHAVVASSTSTLMPSLLQQDCAFAERLLIGHPFNPPHIIPLVEVVGGERTSDAAIDRAMDFYTRAGKHPIRLNRERPGHLANRLQAAVWREAIDAVACGQASVADVDAAMTLALGPRWALTGPFATFNLGGGSGGLRHFIDHLGEAFDRLGADLGSTPMSPALADRLVAEASRMQGARPIADIAATRDRLLTSVLAAGRQMNG